MSSFASSSRRTFLGRFGRTLALGVGVAAVPTVAGASPSLGVGGDTAIDAYARPRGGCTGGNIRYRCCTNTQRCGGCGGNQVKYRCISDRCTSGFCTVCRDFRGDCFDLCRAECA